MGTEKLAINGGSKAVGQLGPFPTKIGRDELLEVLDLWQFSPENETKIKQIIESETNLRGPHLFRYYNPAPSKVAAAEAVIPEQLGVADDMLEGKFSQNTTNDEVLLNSSVAEFQKYLTKVIDDYGSLSKMPKLNSCDMAITDCEHTHRICRTLIKNYLKEK